MGTTHHGPVIFGVAIFTDTRQVYGYDDTMAVAGDLFEAETDCVHDLGQVASNGCSNLAFYRSVSLNTNAP